MEEIYPWKKQIPESYEKSRKRRFPKKLKNFQQNELYTRIIPHEINRALCGEITEEEALSNMEMHIKSKSEVLSFGDSDQYFFCFFMKTNH